MLLSLLLAALGVGGVFLLQKKPSSPPAQRKPAARIRVVCIDPGHPSEVSSGGEVQNGAREVAVNWQVSCLLRDELSARGITVVMTKRSESEAVSNRKRASVANGCGAALFLRLHCDTGPGEGIAFYYPDRAGKSGGHTGPSRAVIAESARAAAAIHKGTLAALGGELVDNGIKPDSATLVGGRQGALTGSIFSEVPVVTVEMVYLSHPADARFISSVRGQKMMAAALADGVAAYLGK